MVLLNLIQLYFWILKIFQNVVIKRCAYVVINLYLQVVYSPNWSKYLLIKMTVFVENMAVKTRIKSEYLTSWWLGNFLYAHRIITTFRQINLRNIKKDGMQTLIKKWFDQDIPLHDLTEKQVYVCSENIMCSMNLWKV